MTFQLIDGHFTATEAVTILTQIVDVKVKFHESKISHSDNEEDIKMRETRIKALQNDLTRLKRHIAQHGAETVTLQAEIAVEVDELVAA